MIRVENERLGHEFTHSNKMGGPVAEWLEEIRVILKFDIPFYLKLHSKEEPKTLLVRQIDDFFSLVRPEFTSGRYYSKDAFLGKFINMRKSERRAYVWSQVPVQEFYPDVIHNATRQGSLTDEFIERFNEYRAVYERRTDVEKGQWTMLPPHAPSRKPQTNPTPYPLHPVPIIIIFRYNF